MLDALVNKRIDFNAILKRVLERHESDIQELNQEQLMSGKKSDGTSLSPYSPAYAKRKGKPLTPKTLKDTGNFHEGIFSTFFEKSFTMQSENYKSDFLESNWTSKIFGLTRESIVKLLDEKGVRKEVIEETKKAFRNV
jgi:hypothetical protein